jgi:uncharacterized membrane protein
MYELKAKSSVRWTGQSGTVMLYVLLGLVALVALTSLAIDVGLAYNARTQTQAAADAAALAAAASMIDKNGPAVTLDLSVSTAVDVASRFHRPRPGHGGAGCDPSR